MEHTQAADTHAAGRYLLGEMRPEEREIFEAHFFDCRICAADIRDGMRLMANARAVAREPQEADSNVRMFPRGGRWVPQAAAAAIAGVLLTVAGYQSVVIPRLAQRSEIIQRARVETSADRDAAMEPASLTAGRPGYLIFPISGDRTLLGEAVSYVCEVRDSTGKVLKTETVSRSEASENVSWLIGELPAGSYELVIRGVRKDGNRFDVTRGAFNVVRGSREGP